MKFQEQFMQAAELAASATERANELYAQRQNKPIPAAVVSHFRRVENYAKRYQTLWARWPSVRQSKDALRRMRQGLEKAQKHLGSDDELERRTALFQQCLDAIKVHEALKSQ